MAHIFQINMSSGGVPKRPVAVAEVTDGGLTGDWQQNRRFHGGPDRALSLFALEHIVALQAEGHPIYPGATGENLTIAGLDWPSLKPGMRLRLGAEVEIELTSYVTPCRTIAAAFRDEAFTVISEKLHPGRARLYARVLHPGAIHIGDPVVVTLPVGSGA